MLSEGRAASYLCTSTAHPGALHSTDPSSTLRGGMRGERWKTAQGPTADPTRLGSSSWEELAFGDNYMKPGFLPLPFLISTILIRNSNLQCNSLTTTQPIMITAPHVHVFRNF